jgi:polyisoprenoid-binding protein YceI
MKRSRMTTMAWVLACASLSPFSFWAHGVAALGEDIVFAPKAFFDNGDVSVEISGTLTGKDVPKNNTVSVSCYKVRIPMMPISHSSGSRSVIPIDPDQCGVA